jgi:chromosome segregation ATPase
VNDDQLTEIRSTTEHLSKEMRLMRKIVEDLQMSINEKDAEIIKLNMHLGDEKKRLQNLMRMQHSSQKSLAHNASTQSLLKPKEPLGGSGEVISTPKDGLHA